MKRVILESPYAGDVERNLRYARACMHDSLMRDEAPIASHLLYTQPGILDDNIPDERFRGIKAGCLWWLSAELVVFYVNLGLSKGMRKALEHAVVDKKPYEIRTLPDNWETPKKPRDERIPWHIHQDSGLTKLP